MFANTLGAGLDFAFADVCLTPPIPVPIPYGNEASSPNGVNPVWNVVVGGAPVFNMSTIIGSTSGDDAGVAGGVSSGTVMGISQHITGATTVLIGGAPVTRLTDQTQQNNANVVGSRVAPSQIKLLVLAG
jgi:hypothetical protein